MSRGPRVTSFSGLISEGAKHEENGDLISAIACYRNAASLRPDAVSAADALASAYMENGDPANAERELRRAISLEPQGRFERYAYLGQLLGNTEEAVQSFRSALDCITKERDDPGAVTEERKHQLIEYEASTHCAIAEILLAIIEDSNDHALAARMDAHVEQSVTAALGICSSGDLPETEALLALVSRARSQ